MNSRACVILFLAACLVGPAGCSPSQPPAPAPVTVKPLYKVTRYGDDGTVLKVWEDVIDFDTTNTNNRVKLVDPQTGKATMSFGITVIEQTNTRNQPRPQTKPWSVNLYGANGRVVRSWSKVADIDWTNRNDRLKFVDTENRLVIVFGNLIATED